MLLTDLRDYLSTRKRASISDMAARFGMDVPAMEGLLATWVAKGRVRLLKNHLPCGTCGKCESATADIYEWVGINGCPDPTIGYRG
jgi:putative ferrous iron transport protein C